MSYIGLLINRKAKNYCFKISKIYYIHEIFAYMIIIVSDLIKYDIGILLLKQNSNC